MALERPLAEYSLCVLLKDRVCDKDRVYGCHINLLKDAISTKPDARRNGALYPCLPCNNGIPGRAY
jgi:hypothetical protein